MGHRSIKRVPLDFDWPLKQTWDGYVSPCPRPCPEACENGQTLAGRWLTDVTHLLLMLGEASIDDRPLHPWLQAVEYRPDAKPSSDMVELTTGLAGRAPSFLGHDACDRWAAFRAITKAAGVSESWGTCRTCHGHACHPDDIWMTEEDSGWVPTDPPTGEGWQLWETTSEGSPVSPVFDSAEALAYWCVEGASPFGSFRWSYDEWLRFIAANDDSATLMVGSSEGFRPLGVTR